MTAAYLRTVRRPGVQPFLWTQFLGALNDNVFKMIVSLVAVSAAGMAGSGYLSWVGAVFAIPFLLFSGYAGQLADGLSKRSVLIATKFLEIVAMGLGILALASGRIELLLAVLFLMAAQSAFFSPAKYGIVPEILPDAELSRANGVLEMTTFVAIIIGTSLGGVLFEAVHDHLSLVGVLATGIAVAGTATSFFIPRVPPARSAWTPSLHPWSSIGSSLGLLYRDRALWLTVLGISYFWFLGALLQMVVILFGHEFLRVGEIQIAALGASMALGIACGSIAAGRLSGEKVELGLVPLGALGMCAFLLVLSGTTTLAGAAAALAAVGFAAGFFIVPLNALLQQRAAAGQKGHFIAANNFLNTVAILLASGVLWLLRDLADVPAGWIILVSGVFTLLASMYAVTLLPEFLVRFVLWMLTHTVYRIRMTGVEHVPFRGPALLVCNHMSHVDGFLVGACVQRFIRFIVYRPFYDMRALHWLMRLMNAIPVQEGKRADVVESIARARDELQRGHVVCIFAEGTISRTGNMLPFKRGFERIIEGLNVPVIPVHLDRLWGSVFSFKGGRFVWKWPERIPYPVSVTFGAPLPATTTAQQARQAILELGSDAMAQRFGTGDLLQARFIRTAKRCWGWFCMADSTGRELTFGRVLTGSLLIARRVKHTCRDERCVGVLLPASVAGALVNAGITLAGKVPVNINFTAGKDAMASAVTQCGISTVMTSRTFLAKARLEAPATPCFVEDLLGTMGNGEKAIAAVVTRLLPAPLLIRLLGCPTDPETLATIIFSSGSTGTPKGIMLSHRNVVANTESMAQVFWLTREDRIMGVLPFFHSFGYTGSIWLPLLAGFGAAYHMSPLDAKTIGEMIARYRCTLMISTPTFYAAYLRKCEPQQLATLRYGIVGAEKLREVTADAFREKFGIDLLEGYGCTEMSPAVSVNVPDYAPAGQRGAKRGTVGHPLPGVAVKVVDPDTWTPREIGEQGLLLVKGPNLMIGYLGNRDKTREAIRDGWYITGDIASIDEDGFIRITDRLARFSKIAGEMVPHVGIEEQICAILGDSACVVTSVPDESSGERIVAFYTSTNLTPEELWDRLCHCGMPRLWLPRRDCLFNVETIPLLGTGKVDFGTAKRLAREMITPV